MTSHLLAADIGGTKTLLCLGRIDGECFQVLKQQRYASTAFSGFEAVLADFLYGCPLPLTGACLGVAGPVTDGVCRTTNLPWLLDAAALSQALAGTPVQLLNDLEAAAYGILELPPDRLVDLNPDAVFRPGKPRAVIAAGTGLGEALIIQSESGPLAVATEGGHCDFAPRDTLEDELLLWLRQRFPDHVSYERLVSGPGLVHLYQFLRDRDPGWENPRVAAAMDVEDPAAVISRWGLEGGDPLCLEALNRFVSLYGAEAGNLALKSLALGGIYLAGGIAPKILPLLRQGGFLDAFVAKGRYRELLRVVPIRVVQFDEVVLLGALAWLCGRVLRMPQVGVYNGLTQLDN